MPWWDSKPETEIDDEFWRLEQHLGDLIDDFSAIEDTTGVRFNPKKRNYKKILETVAVENDLCRGVDYLDTEKRSFSLELIRGHYLQVEIDRLTKDYEDLLALIQSGGDYKGREKKLPPKKMQ